MRTEGVHVIIIIGSIVTLDTVAGIYQYDIFRTCGIPDAVHRRGNSQERTGNACSHVEGIEITAVDIVSGTDVESIAAVPGSA